MSGDRFGLAPLRRRADSRQVCDERMAAIAPRGCLAIQSGISPPSVTESAAMSKPGRLAKRSSGGSSDDS